MAGPRSKRGPQFSLEVYRDLDAALRRLLVLVTEAEKSVRLLCEVD